MAAFWEYIFWISLSIIIYTYAGYPVLLALLVSIKKVFNKETVLHPAADLSVTVIISAYNEENIISEKISNTLALDYTASLLKIIVVTDGSTDDTPQIVKRFNNIQLLHHDERKGKLSAMNRAVQFADSEILVFTDANGMLNKSALKEIIKHYSAEKVGAVSGEKKIITTSNNGVSGGEGMYWRYESLLKKLDSQLCTVVGAAGELFSVRRNLYKPLEEDTIIEDFVQSLLLCTQGYVVRYEPGAYSEEEASTNVNDELERKIRISAGAFQAMRRITPLYNVFRYPLIFFQLVSHRLLRWTLAPLALLLLFFAAPILCLASDSHNLYCLAAVFQGLFYLMAIYGWTLTVKKRRAGPFYLPFYFLFMNYCVYAGFLRYIGRRQGVVWKKAAR